MDRIIVGDDFSESSNRARQHAADLARAHAAELTVAHACSYPQWLNDGRPRRGPAHAAISELRHRVGADLSERARRLERAGAEHESRGVATDTRLLHDDAKQALSRLAQLLEADVIVVGTHDRTALERLFHRSTAESTLRGADRPVLVARGPSPGIHGYRSVLVPIDFGRSAEATARAALRWTAAGGCVELFHASPPLLIPASPIAGGPLFRTAPERVTKDADRRGAKLVERLRTERVNVRFGRATGPTVPTILERAATGSFDLVVVRDSGARKWRRWLSQSLPKQLVRHGSSSVLVLPAQ